MCGIAGFIDLSSPSEDSLNEEARRMAAALHHRGPDAFGIWTEGETGLALVHTRLAIIDLSEHGKQPMRSASGRYVLIYNGEIYNFLSLREDLAQKGHTFRGHSDTEVLLAAIEEWGIQQTLNRLNGMFAFALWDKKTRTLTLARDRMGQKPLYYGWNGNRFFFASELKALRAHSGFSPTIDRAALNGFIRNNYVPAPLSIYEGIRKLPPASTLSIAPHESRTPEAGIYWDIGNIAQTGCADPFTGSFTEAVDALDEILGDAVRQRMVSDVPLGSFLSGGIDSSLITALMQKQASEPVRTFSIGFEEAAYNEADDAQKIADHLGTEHTTFTVTADQARTVIPALPEMFDEPFADPSQIPTWWVSKLAREHVTVALSGDGGDEAFYGYGRYPFAKKLSSLWSLCPPPLREPLAGMMDALPLSGKLAKGIPLLKAADQDALYAAFMSYWRESPSPVLGYTEPTGIRHDTPPLKHFEDRMMYQDMRAYLPDDILVKVDRASMAVSLEARAPFMDYRVIEFAWKTPLAFKYKDQTGKYILRALLERYVPKTLFDRPKQGFGIPHGEWMKGPLKDWASALLDEKRLNEEGFFDPAPVLKKWQEHLSGTRNWSYDLWSILMFQAWLERWKV